MARTKYVTIESPGKISVLGGLLGPITTPSYIDINIIISLINSGKVVYEVNPSNVKEKIRLTRKNVLNYNFKSKVNNGPTKEVIKSEDVGFHKTPAEQSVVNTTIVQEPNKGMIGFDIFVSNKYS